MRRSPLLSMLVVLLACSSASTARGEAPAASLLPIHSWAAVDPPTPSTRAVFAYDPLRDRAIVLGGTQPGPPTHPIPLDRAWVLSFASPAAEWQTLAIGGGQPTAAVIAGFYDATRDRLVCVAEDASVWAIALSTTPSWSPLGGGGPGGATDAVLDAGRDRVLMLQAAGGLHLWQFPLSGGSWSEVPTANPPPERYEFSVALDAGRDDLLMFGGWFPCIFCPDELNDTWRLDLGSNAWTKLEPTGLLPDERFQHAAAYDPVGDRMLVFGGQAAALGINDNLWGLSLAGTPGWTHLGTLVTPAPRTVGRLVLDPGRGRMLLFGGRVLGGQPLNDLWAFRLEGLGVWEDLSPQAQPPSRRYGAPAAYDPLGNRMLLFGGFDGTFRGDTWALGLGPIRRWESLTPSGDPPAARYMHTAITDPARGRVLIFGGFDGSDYRNDVWELALGASPAWRPVVTAGVAPSPRAMHSAVLDAAGGRMIVFGGETGPGTYADDAIALDLATDTWAPADGAGPRPAPRRWHSAAWDPSPGRMVVFGGRGSGGTLGDAWALSAAGTWSPLTAAGVPPSAREGATAVYDGRGDRMLFYSGATPTYEQPNDVWSLGLGDGPTWSPIVTSGRAPGPVAHHACVLHPTDGQLLVFGGTTNGNPLPDPHAWALQLPYAVGVPVADATRPSLSLAVSPNPASRELVVRFTLPRPGAVRVELLGLDGRRMATLLEAHLREGPRSIRWSDAGRSLPAGLYWVRVLAGSTSEAVKVAWLR